MTKARDNRLPYIRGGVPGALTVLLFVMGILSILSAVGVLVQTFATIQRLPFMAVVELLWIALGSVPSFILGIGALKLRRGGSAAAVVTAFRFRRVMIAVTMAALVILTLIDFFRIVGVSFPASLLVLLIYGLIFGVLLFVLFFVNRVIAAMEVVDAEVADPGQPRDIRSYTRSPAWMSLLWAILIGAAALLYLIVPGFALDNFSFGAVSGILGFIVAILFLQGGELALGWGFFRGVWRSHRAAKTGQPWKLGSPRYLRTNTWAILSAILSAFLAVWYLMVLINRGSAYAQAGRSFPWDRYAFDVVRFAAAAVLAVGLLFRRRSVVILIASALMTGGYVYRLVELFRGRPEFFTLAGCIAGAVFFALLALSAILCLRPEKRLPKGLRIPLIILSALTLGFGMIAEMPGMTGSRSDFAVWLLYSVNYFVPAVLAFFLRLDLSLAVGWHVDEADEVAAEEEQAAKETLYEKALRLGCQPIRLRGVKHREVQDNLERAVVGWVCTVEREVRKGKDDRWRVCHGLFVLGSLRDEEYTEGQAVVLAAVETDEDGIRRPSVMVL